MRKGLQNRLCQVSALLGPRVENSEGAFLNFPEVLHRIVQRQTSAGA